MRYYITIILLLLANLMNAKDDPKYPVNTIPANLREGMYAVVREDISRFEIMAINNSRYYVHKVITILNEKGKAYASEAINYDKLEKILSISAYVYNAEGELIKKLKNAEIIDRSNYDGLFSDNRIKIFDLSQSVYPYTVEYEYEKEKEYLYFIPPYIPYTDDEVSIQKSSFEITFPSNLKPQYRLNKMPEPKKERTEDIEKFSWKFEDFKPEKFEWFAPSDILPNVLLAPSDFEYDGYKGSMSSWSSLGRWQLLLNKGKGELPESTKRKVIELTKNLTTVEQKTKTLYEYLQNKTRYVSIQEGIGGLQPFSAKDVDENGYGDCKALSNYMVSLLKVVGIKGYYTKIRSGENESEIIDFPSHQTNHIIVSVPNEKDTLWLECTSQTNPFGYLGKFTGDRWALMITEQEGKLVRTPKLKTELNTQIQKAEVHLDKSGNAKAKVITAYSGLQYENNGLAFRVNQQPDDQKKWLQETISIPSFEIGSFTFRNNKEKIPSAIVNVDLTLNRYASVSGKRIFLAPNLMNRSTYIPPKAENRKNKVSIKSSFVDVDSITYHVSEEIYPEFIPPSVKINNQYGDYEASYTFEQGKLLYIRKLKMKPGEFPASSYSELVNFYKAINKADNTKMVFLSKT